MGRASACGGTHEGTASDRCAGQLHCRPLETWRCPHCGTTQADAARCWACSRHPMACGSCRDFRRAVAGRLGYCALDRTRAVLQGDEIRACWRAPVRHEPLEGLFLGLEPRDRSPGAGTASNAIVGDRTDGEAVGGEVRPAAAPSGEPAAAPGARSRSWVIPVLRSSVPSGVVATPRSSTGSPAAQGSPASHNEPSHGVSSHGEPLPRGGLVEAPYVPARPFSARRDPDVLLASAASLDHQLGGPGERAAGRQGDIDRDEALAGEGLIGHAEP